MRIFVVEDHANLRDALVTVLAGEGHTVMGVSCAEELAEADIARGVDLYVVDIGLPGEDGLSLMRRLRALDESVALLALSARSVTAARIEGYRAGADLYLCKPLDFDELTAAVDALGRRVREAALPRALRLRRPGGVVEGPAGDSVLSEREVRLLVAFGHASHTRLERWQVAEILGIDPDAAARATLERAVARLRAKLRCASGVRLPIRARRGFGYELCVGIVME